MSSSALSALADQVEWFALGGGRLLFDQDEDSDGMYLLVHGRLSASRRQADGSLRTLGTIAAGETVGETGLLAGEPRNARVVALRDCELLFLPRLGFEQLARVHPEAMLRLVQLALKRSYGRRSQEEYLACFALLPAHAGLDLSECARDFIAALDGSEQTELIDADKALEKPPGWFAEREAAMRHLVYLGNEDEDWRSRCVRQSDCVLLIADASRPAQLCTPLPVPTRGPAVPVHLVLVNPRGPSPGSTAPWLERLPQGRAHHHIRGPRDIARLVRRLTRGAVGLVLSGGGARGFAHLGTIRALREHGWTFDYVGGTSIGAIIGAGVACDWDDATLREVYHRAFVASNPLADWTLPLVSLRSGRSVVRRLREAFGNLDIEDLPIPFFCVSSDLTEGALQVHETETLWRALRASCAIPGVLPPLFRHGRVLVDGGVIDNLPVSEMRRRIFGPIIASDVGGEYRLPTDIDEDHLPGWWELLPELFGRRRRPRIGQILLRSGMVNSALGTQRARKLSRLLLTPSLEGIDLLDWDCFERAETAGYEYACERLRGMDPPAL
nr:patatin-like phospholipase family protein [Lysobacter sp. CAU 1642]